MLLSNRFLEGFQIHENEWNVGQDLQQILEEYFFSLCSFLKKVNSDSANLRIPDISNYGCNEDGTI